MASAKKYCWTVKGVLDKNFPEYVSPRKSLLLPYKGPDGLEVQFLLRFQPGVIVSERAHRLTTSHFDVCLEVVRCTHPAIRVGFKITCGGPPDINLMENTTNEMVWHEFVTQTIPGRKYEWRVGAEIMTHMKNVIHRNCPAPRPAQTILEKIAAFWSPPQASKEDFNITLHIYKVDVSLSELKATKKSTDEFLRQFWSMYTEKKLVDFSLIVGNKDFGVHKLILAARSPVFAAMFDHKVAETAQNLVVITDFEVTTIENFINFLYTGKCDLKEHAAELLVCAEKYNVDQLKSECQAVLMRQLKSDNAAFLLQLSDIHRAARLKEAALKFISQHTKEAMLTPQWASLRPELLNEVIQYVKNAK